jgi:hypothetical protein
MPVQANPGVYRGVCVDNRDPQKLGRIRVSVPQVMGTSATGWAFPAWTLDDWTKWPEDRIPTPDQGVWVIFEGPDKMTWLATYGPQEFSKQALDDDADAEGSVYQTTITWTFAMLPQDVPTTITGTLSSPSGTPNPDPFVVLQKSENGTTWTDTPSQGLVALDGKWSLSYTRSGGEVNYWYRARFPGLEPFWPAVSPAEQIRNTSTALTWTPPALNWQNPVPISGYLKDANNAGIVGAPIIVSVSRDGGTTWTTETTATSTTGGSWVVQWTRKKADIAAMLMRASFVGDLSHDSSITAPVTLAAVTVATSLTMTVPAFVFNTAATVSGVLSTASYGVPSPSTVEFWSRTPATTGTWTKVKDIAANTTTGAWSTSHTQTAPSCDYKAVYPGTTAPWQPVETAVSTRNVAAATTTSAPTFPATLVHGTGFTVTGTVIDSLSRPVAAGSCALWYRFANGADTAWKTSGAPAVTPSASGSYSLTHPALTVVGPLDWKVVYTGTSAYLNSESTSVSKSIGLNGVTGITKGAVGHSSAAFSWASVSGATDYEVTRNSVVQSHPTATSYTASSLAEQTDYTFAVRPRKADAGGNYVYGSSASAKMNTGRSQQSKSGAFGYEARPTATNTWRPADNWGYSGDDVLQGYFSNSSYVAYGTMTYDGAAFQNWVRSNYGQDVLDHLNWTHCQVAMYRVSGSGSGSSLGLTWYVSPATAGSGGQPPLAGGSAWGSFTPGQSGWVVFSGAAHWGGHVLLNQDVGQGPCRSFVIYRNNSGDYSRYGGKSDYSNACNIYVECNWNFVSVSEIAAGWY